MRGGSRVTFKRGTLGVPFEVHLSEAVSAFTVSCNHCLVPELFVIPDRNSARCNIITFTRQKGTSLLFCDNLGPGIVQWLP